ncbi:hypothetical protein VCHE46_0268B, partial [Vibrio cholerae HE-46]
FYQSARLSLFPSLCRGGLGWGLWRSPMPTLLGLV